MASLCFEFDVGSEASRKGKNHKSNTKIIVIEQRNTRMTVIFQLRLVLFYIIFFVFPAKWLVYATKWNIEKRWRKDFMENTDLHTMSDNFKHGYDRYRMHIFFLSFFFYIQKGVLGALNLKPEGARSESLTFPKQEKVKPARYV